MSKIIKVEVEDDVFYALDTAAKNKGMEINEYLQPFMKDIATNNIQQKKSFEVYSLEDVKKALASEDGMNEIKSHIT